MTIPDLATLDDVRHWLADLPPRQRVHLARLFADRAVTGELTRTADATVYEKFQTKTADQVAEDLDLSVAQVRRAVAAHKKRAREQPGLPAKLEDAAGPAPEGEQGQQKDS